MMVPPTNKTIPPFQEWIRKQKEDQEKKLKEYRKMLLGKSIIKVKGTAK